LDELFAFMFPNYKLIRVRSKCALAQIVHTLSEFAALRYMNTFQ